MKNIFKGTFILLIVIAIFFSSIALAEPKIKQNQIIFNTIDNFSSFGSRGPVVWDNGMDWWDGILAAQEPITAGNVDGYPADDFYFEEDTKVCDVHWEGGFFVDEYEEWEWCILFYNDRGDGAAPGEVYEGPFCYTWDEIEKEFQHEWGWNMSVDLPEIIFFPGNYKWWISIWAVGDYPPQSGWWYHKDPVKLHEAVFKSEFFGYPEWTNKSDLPESVPSDMNFQLTTLDNTPPLSPIIYGPTNGFPFLSYSFRFSSTDLEGDEISYYIEWGDGKVTDWTTYVPSGSPGYSESHSWKGLGKFIIKAKAKDNEGLESSWTEHTISIPRNRAINTPFHWLQNFLHFHPNLFPIIRQLLGL